MDYAILPNNKFMQAAREIVEHETNPAVTVELRSLVDLSAVEAVRNKAADGGGRKPSYTAFVIKAVALTLKEFPHANCRVFRRPWLPLLGPRLQAFRRVDIAVAAERQFPGMELISLVDIIRDADRKSLAEISEWLTNLAKSDTSSNAQWRTFHSIITALPTWLSALLVRLPVWIPALWIKYRGGAVLVTSPAKYGPDEVAGHWTAPLGFSFGFVKKRPVVVNDEVVARQTFYLLLHFDRRTLHGGQGARLFQRVVEMLEKAELGE
jgi:pyruvate/2-oxoglutarate dehydrogenase complex dihydrolipoamide acyltransferase (E2) component